MMKYHEKIVLKSPTFKSKQKTSNRSHSRSPSQISIIKNEPIRVDPNQLFQRVCCPNCRYLFKVIKEDTTAAMEGKPRQEREKIKQDKSIQTQFLRKNDDQMRDSIEKQIDRHKELNNLSLSLSEAPLKLPSPKQNYINESTYRMQSLTPKSKSPPPNPYQSRRSSVIKSHFQQQKQRKEQLALSQLQAAKKKEIKGKLIDEQVLKKLRQQVVHAYIANEEGKELKRLIEQLPRGLQIPAYCKMLVFE